MYNIKQTSFYFETSARLGRITDKIPEEMRELMGQGDAVITLELT
jgi:hypothetical protein